MSINTIQQLISSLEESYYNIDLSVFQSPDIKLFTINFPIILKHIKEEINNLLKTDKPIDIDYINTKQLEILSNSK